jgi:hypothetical protein
MLNIGFVCSTCQVCQMTKKEHTGKKYGLFLPKIAESDTASLGLGMCGSGGTTPFTIRTPAKTHSLLALTMIDPATGWFYIVEATNKSAFATSIQDLFITPVWHVTRDLNLLSLTMGCVGEFKREFKQMCNITIMALKPNQLQVTTINPQANAIIERVHKVE